MLAQRDLLDPQIADFADQQIVLVAAVDGVHGTEFLRHLAGAAEFADDRPVQFHLVDFAGLVDVVRRIGIGDIKHRIRTRGHADRLGISEIADLRLEGAVVVEDLDAVVVAVGDIDIALRVNRNAADIVELALAGALLAPAFDEFAVLVEFGDARIALAVGDENVALGIPGDIGRTVEDVLRPPSARCTGRPAATFPTAGRSRTGGNVDRLGLSAEQHDLTALLIEFHDHVGHLIDHPDIVLRIDAYLIGEHEPVGVLADFADEASVAIELVQLRAAMGEIARSTEGDGGMAGAGVY